jgi:hypothetical protein
MHYAHLNYGHFSSAKKSGRAGEEERGNALATGS